MSDTDGIDPPWRLDPFQNIVAFGIGPNIQLSLACELSNDNSHDPTTIVPGFTVNVGNGGNIIAGADDFVGFEWFAPDGVTNWAATAPAPAAQTGTSSNIYSARATFLLSRMPSSNFPLSLKIAINPSNVDDPAVFFSMTAQTTKFPGSSLLAPITLSTAEADDVCNPLPMNTTVNATINVDTSYNVTITVDDYDLQTINWLELSCYGAISVPGVLESNYTVLSWTSGVQPLSPGGDITSTSSTAFYVTDDPDLTYAEAGLPEMAYRIPAFAGPAPGQLAQIPPGDAVQGSLSSAFFNLDKLGVPFSVDLLVNGNYSGGDLALYYLQAQTYNAIPCQANVVLSTGIDNDKGTAVTLRVSVDADYNVSIAMVP